MPRRLHDRPVLAALAGALAISFSGILFVAADVSPATGATYRCLLALPLLWPLSWLEDRKYGPRPLRQRALAWLAGVFFALDLILWHEGIEQVGAGLATVLGNLQVVFVGLLAWAILGERPSNRSLEPGSTILIDRKNEDEVDITIIPGEITPEKVTVPPDEPTDAADDEPDE